MTSLAMLHLKKEPEQVELDMEAVDLAAQDLAAQDLVDPDLVDPDLAVSVVLEKARAVLTEVRMAAIRNSTLKAVTWTIF